MIFIVSDEVDGTSTDILQKSTKVQVESDSNTRASQIQIEKSHTEDDRSGSRPSSPTKSDTKAVKPIMSSPTTGCKEALDF